MKDIVIEPATGFDFKPADYVPFRDREVCERLRKISGKDLEKYHNPDFKIKVMLNPHCISACRGSLSGAWWPGR